MKRDDKVHLNGTEPAEHKMVVPWDNVSVAMMSQLDDDGVLLYKAFQFQTPTGDIVFPIRVMPTSPAAESKFDKAVKVFMEELLEFQKSESA